MVSPTPATNCDLCPRLAQLRNTLQKDKPTYFNAPVPCFGDKRATLLIVGLAPGLHGANRTGRPFTGDDAGDLLYATLEKFGFCDGEFDKNGNDKMKLINCLITNAVRCVPPQNKPISHEINQCRDFLRARLTTQKQNGLRGVLALGHIAHESVLRAEAVALKNMPFAHGARHDLDSFVLYDSYHCSRYNTNTRRLTPAMFEEIFATIKRDLFS